MNSHGIEERLGHFNEDCKRANIQAEEQLRQITVTRTNEMEYLGSIILTLAKELETTTRRTKDLEKENAVLKNNLNKLVETVNSLCSKNGMEHLHLESEAKVHYQKKENRPRGGRHYPRDPNHTEPFRPTSPIRGTGQTPFRGTGPTPFRGGPPSFRGGPTPIYGMGPTPIRGTGPTPFKP
ncbi:hypothetical protein QTN25_001405 [Entamoeba marina]